MSFICILHLCFLCVYVYVIYRCVKPFVCVYVCVWGGGGVKYIARQILALSAGYENLRHIALNSEFYF